MNQDDKSWADGWRVVLTCNECKSVIWAKKIGQTVKCKCDIPNYITDSPHNFDHGANKDNYEIVLMKAEQPY